MPVPRQRDEPGGDARLLELVVELLDDRGATPRRPLDRPDLRAQLEDPRLEVVLLRLELVAVSTSGVPLLGRVADPRALRRELGRDQEAEAEERRRRGSAASSGSRRTRPITRHVAGVPATARDQRWRRR